MKRSILAFIAGLVAGAIGFYAGLFALLAVTGLDGAGSMPPVATAGAVGVGLAAVAAVNRLGVGRGVVLVLVGLAVGAGLGALLGQMVDSFEWTLAASALVIAVAAFWPAINRPPGRISR